MCASLAYREPTLVHHAAACASGLCTHPDNGWPEGATGSSLALRRVLLAKRFLPTWALNVRVEGGLGGTGTLGVLTATVRMQGARVPCVSPVMTGRDNQVFGGRHVGEVGSARSRKAPAPCSLTEVLFVHPCHVLVSSLMHHVYKA